MATGSRVIVLKPKDINSIAYDNYRHIDEKKITEYYTSIKEAGVVVPVKIKKTKEGITLIDGHHRVECARRIMKDYPHILLTMEAIVDESQGDSKSEAVDKVVSNFQRRESILDRALGYQLLRDTGKSIQQVADTVGKDRSTIENHLHFLVVYQAHKEFIGSNLEQLKDAFLYRLGQKYKRDPKFDVVSAIQKELAPKERKGAASSPTEQKDPEVALVESGYTKTDAKKICRTLRSAGFQI
jgi:ParB/RepB/Spo0J family partition protein